MATFNIRLDTRNKLKDDKFNLVIRVFEQNTFVDLKVERLTQRQYHRIFIKNATDETSIEFRRRTNELKSFVEELYHQIGYLNNCLLYTSPSPRDRQKSRMPSSA